MAFSSLRPMIFGVPGSLFVLDVIKKKRRLEMSDFERFGLICEEWLEAAKEDTISEEEDN
jgi:hypothetical protein